MRFGEKLRALRKERGLTQAELAKEAGLGLKTITNYEKGNTYPQNREVYSTLAKILGCETAYLHNEDDDFVSKAQQEYGYRGKKDAEKLLADATGLFAGDTLSAQDEDAVMKALQDIYWAAKARNAEKYTPKKYKKQSEEDVSAE